MTENTSADRRRDTLLCLLLAVGVVAVYAQVYRFEFLSYDDTLYVSENPLIYSGFTREGAAEVVLHGHYLLWIPLTSFTYMLGCELYGLSAAGHHLTNVLFHLANVLLLFWVLRKLTGRVWPSALVAGLFAIHPLNVEPVAWVSGRKDLVYTLFWVLTLAAYGRYVRRPGAKRYLWVLACHGLGLAAKSSQVTMPFVLLLLDYWPLKRCTLSGVAQADGRKKLAKLALEKLPLLALSGLIAVSTYVSVERGGGARSLEAVPLADRIMNAAVVYTFYTAKLFWPSGLTVHYPYPVDGFPTWQVVAAFAVLIGVTVATLALLRKCPYLAVGWFWYLIALFPVCGLMRATSFLTADRYAYVPMIGLFIMLAWSGAALVAKAPRLKRGLAVAAAAYLAGLAMCASIQTRCWRSSIALFEHAVRVTPNSPIPHNNLGTALRRAGRYDEAITHFTRAIDIPGPFKVHPHMNLGTLLAEQGRLDEAAAHFAKVVQHNPGYQPAHVFLAKVCTDRDRTEEAIRQYTQALVLEPEDAETRRALDGLLAGEPDFLMAHNALGKAYYALGKLEQAIGHYTQALRIGPDHLDTHNNLGVALGSAGRYDEAATHFNEILALHPDNTDALNNLGTVLASRGRTGEAIARFNQVLQIAPDNLTAHYNLARALAEQGRLDEAAGHYVAVLRINPHHTGARRELERLRSAARNLAPTER